MEKKGFYVVWGVMALLLLASCERCRDDRAAKKAVALIRAYEKEIAPLDKGVAVAEYEAAQGGSPFVYERLYNFRLERALALSAPERFQTVARWHADKTFKDPYLSRQIDQVYYNTLMCRADTAMLTRMARLETYLYEQVVTFLATDPPVVEATGAPRLDVLQMEAHQAVGALLKDSIVALVHCRNQVVRQAGFSDFYQYQLARMDQNADSLDIWFHTFDTITAAAFRHLKAEIDTALAARYGILPEALQVWHYQSTFFQDIFNLYDIGQFRSYENKNVANLAVGFYESIGLYARDIFMHSDLRKRSGKAPFTHSYDLDGRGDVRLLCSMSSDMESMSELLWHGGIALYRKNISGTLPYLLRNMDYSVLCEGAGRVFRRLPFNVTWLQGMGIMYMPSDMRRVRYESYMNLHAQQLIFCRWGLVMYWFERALYQDPDQDLDKLWRELECKYQFSPAVCDVETVEDWVTKWHLVLRPCYYHNYLLGSAVACQLNAYVCDSILHDPDYWTPDYMASEEIGAFFKNKIFWCGDAYPWYEILEQATGQPFSLRYYAQWLIGSEPYVEWRAGEDAADEARRRKYLSEDYIE